jgi:SAM-dependent methyltransferase
MLDLATARQVFDTLYGGVNGYIISSQARNKLSFHDKSHTYGEVIPDTFHKVLTAVKPKKGEVFYDLGSGTGKAVMMAALMFPFAKTVGVEILKDLHGTAESIKARFDTEIKPHLDNYPKDQEIEFINGDFLQVDFSQADVVFAHSTCYHDELWSMLQRKFLEVKVGARVIMVTKTMHSPHLKPLLNDEFQMGWGRATVYAFERV